MEDPKEKLTTVANDDEKRWRGGKGPQAKIDERVNACYGYILEGGTRSQITERLSSRFDTSIRTSDNDYAAAMQLLKTEQLESREQLLNQIQALRLAVVKKAIKARNFQTAQALLADLGAVIGERAPEQLAVTAPQLTVKIEKPQE